MREIKFRVWNKATNKWHESLEDFNLNQLNNCKEVIDSGYVIQQFIGLRDKNGHEIYEGDVIYIDGSADYVVIWSDLKIGWDIDCIFRQDYEPFMSNFELSECGADKNGNFTSLEIIGNIFENSNLIIDWKYSYNK